MFKLVLLFGTLKKTLPIICDPKRPPLTWFWGVTRQAAYWGVWLA